MYIPWLGTNVPHTHLKEIYTIPLHQTHNIYDEEEGGRGKEIIKINKYELIKILKTYEHINKAA